MNAQSKKIFLSGWEVIFNGDEDCQRFLTTQVVNEAYALEEYSAIELIFENDKLVKAFDYEDGEKLERELTPDEIGMPYQELKPHTIYDISRVEEGHSYLGGEVPTQLTIPTFEIVAPFQYLGMFSPKDSAFDWLPFDLHLLAPTYSGFDKFFMDYSDPLNPVPYHKDDIKNLDNSDSEELKVDSKIIYNKSFIKTTKVNSSVNSYAHTGVPNWIQYPHTPSCPRTGKTMKFLCQITSDTGIETKFTNVKCKNDFLQGYYETMNFWGDGDIYIFFDPESKVACYIIQNT